MVISAGTGYEAKTAQERIKTLELNRMRERGCIYLVGGAFNENHFQEYVIPPYDIKLPLVKSGCSICYADGS